MSTKALRRFFLRANNSLLIIFNQKKHAVMAKCLANINKVPRAWERKQVSFLRLSRFLRNSEYSKALIRNVRLKKIIHSKVMEYIFLYLYIYRHIYRFKKYREAQRLTTSSF